MLKHIIRVLAVLLLGTGVAYGSWNIKQNGDGTTVWENNQTHNQVPVGAPYLTVALTDAGGQITHYISVPVTATISRIDSVMEAVLVDGTPTFTFWIEDATNNHFTQVSGTGSMTIAYDATTGAIAQQKAVTPTGSNLVGRGGVFAIRNDGQGTGGRIRFTITLTPQ